MQNAMLRAMSCSFSATAIARPPRPFATHFGFDVLLRSLLHPSWERSLKATPESSKTSCQKSAIFCTIPTGRTMRTQLLDPGFVASSEDMRILRGCERLPTTCGPPALVARSAHRLHHGLVRMLQEETKMQVCERSSKCSGTCVAKACHKKYPCSQRSAQVSTMAADSNLQRCRFRAA